MGDQVANGSNTNRVDLWAGTLQVRGMPSGAPRETGAVSLATRERPGERNLGGGDESSWPCRPLHCENVARQERRLDLVRVPGHP